jgi:hypothetical protein
MRLISRNLCLFKNRFITLLNHVIMLQNRLLKETFKNEEDRVKTTEVREGASDFNRNERYHALHGRDHTPMIYVHV